MYQISESGCKKLQDIWLSGFVSNQQDIRLSGKITIRYISKFLFPAGASLGNLSAGRVGIIGFGSANMAKALTIAIRYSAVRKQFGPPTQSQEVPVLDYPLQVRKNTWSQLSSKQS